MLVAVKMNHYKALGLSRQATTEEVKVAYKQKVLTEHPDKGGTKERFQAVQQAYEVLMDPVKRAQYDRTAFPLKLQPIPAFRPNPMPSYPAPPSRPVPTPSHRDPSLRPPASLPLGPIPRMTKGEFAALQRSIAMPTGLANLFTQIANSSPR